MHRKKSMIIGCNLNDLFGIKLIFYDSSRIYKLFEFVFNNFLLIDATDRSKISSDHHR